MVVHANLPFIRGLRTSLFLTTALSGVWTKELPSPLTEFSLYNSPSAAHFTHSKYQEMLSAEEREHFHSVKGQRPQSRFSLFALHAAN